MFENLIKLLIQKSLIVDHSNPFTSLTPRERGFQPTGGCANGRAFMSNLRRVKKAQRRRAHLRSLRR